MSERSYSDAELWAILTLQQEFEPLAHVARAANAAGPSVVADIEQHAEAGQSPVACLIRSDPDGHRERVDRFTEALAALAPGFEPQLREYVEREIRGICAPLKGDGPGVGA